MDTVEGLIDAVNIALEAGDWAEVAALTPVLHQAALAMGEHDLADLVQDLHWIASDAVAHPEIVAGVLVS